MIDLFAEHAASPSVCRRAREVGRLRMRAAHFVIHKILIGEFHRHGTRRRVAQKCRLDDALRAVKLPPWKSPEMLHDKGD